jgi:hypothetical protein
MAPNFSDTSANGKKLPHLVPTTETLDIARSHARPSLSDIYIDHPAPKETVAARSETPSQMNSSFDFVIVGGGNAGLALAARLVENSKFTICVLEMGKDCSDMEDPKIPGRSRSHSLSFAYGILRKLHDKPRERI